MDCNTSSSAAWPAGVRVRLRRNQIGVAVGTLGSIVHFFPSVGAYSVRFEPWAALSLVDAGDLEYMPDRERSVGAEELCC
jgi:hypothetical protein